MAAPSAIMKPSRSLSNGIETPLVDSAVMLTKPAVPTGVITDSQPPATITSATPARISRVAYPTA